MSAVLCEDVTVSVGRLSAQAPQSSFPGSSQDGLGAPRTQEPLTDREAAQERGQHPEGDPGPEG